MKQPLTSPLSAEDLQKEVPQIFIEDFTELTDFSNLAWSLAYSHIKTCHGAPQSPFMDEAFAPDKIWIWDTCFMSLYCKYAPHIFPGVESLRNFYVPMCDNVETPLNVHIPDNPPLFAWAEWENYRISGNKEHLDDVFKNHRYPQKMFDVYESFKYGDKPSYMTSAYPIQWQKTIMGYHWSGGRCGMDNTPRGDFSREIYDNDPAYQAILFIDAAAQQALAARIIFEVTGEERFKKEFQRLANLINTCYWDEEDGCYYDISAEAPYKRIKVMTPASFWPLLAGVASQEQAERMAEHLTNPEELGGMVPFVSVARNSKHFCPPGEYWRGGVWLPTAYMCVKALERYGLNETADKLSEDLVMHMFKTWKEFEPHTIWEAYSPTQCEPANNKHVTQRPYSKPDFCGWSALGPINLVIENMLGIHADGVTNTVSWRIHRKCKHGVENLRFGNTKVSLCFENSNISIKTDGAFTLKVPSGEFKFSDAGEYKLEHSHPIGKEQVDGSGCNLYFEQKTRSIHETIKA